MGIGDKILRAFKKIKGKLIVSGILWFILTIVFVAPWGLSYAEGARVSENSNMFAFTRDGWATFFQSLGTNIMHPLSSTINWHNSLQSLQFLLKLKISFSLKTSQTPSEAIIQYLSEKLKSYFLIWGMEINPFPFNLWSPIDLLNVIMPSNGR